MRAAYRRGEEGTSQRLAAEPDRCDQVCPYLFQGHFVIDLAPGFASGLPKPHVGISGYLG